MSVFIQPDDSAAAAAAAEPTSIQQESAAAAAAAEPIVTISSDGDFLPRHIVVMNLLKHHRAEIEKFDNAIGTLMTQLYINRKASDEHKQLLDELEKEQAKFHNPSAAAAAATNSDDAAEPATAAAAAAATPSNKDDRHTTTPPPPQQ
jgi:hypothetical protein